LDEEKEKTKAYDSYYYPVLGKGYGYEEFILGAVTAWVGGGDLV